MVLGTISNHTTRTFQYRTDNGWKKHISDTCIKKFWLCNSLYQKQIQYNAGCQWKTNGSGSWCEQFWYSVCVQVASRVAEERGAFLGHEVGYTIRFDDCSDPQATRIKVPVSICTSGYHQYSIFTLHYITLCYSFCYLFLYFTLLPCFMLLYLMLHCFMALRYSDLYCFTLCTMEIYILQ